MGAERDYGDRMRNAAQVLYEAWALGMGIPPSWVGLTNKEREAWVDVARVACAVSKRGAPW